METHVAAKRAGLARTCVAAATLRRPLDPGCRATHDQDMIRHDGTLTGQLLIAMPALGDPRFHRSVVCVCAHSEQGAMGLIVNRPTPQMRFGALLDSMGIPRGDRMGDIRVHYGGPVERQRGFVLHSDEVRLDRGTLAFADGIAMTATRNILEQISRGGGPRAAVMALGYAGWGPGQLESEIARNDWLTAAPRDDIVFGRADEFKWAAALKSIGVDPLGLSAVGGRA